MARLIMWLLGMAVPLTIICLFLEFLGDLMVASIRFNF
jgi:hypothetical protein